MFKTPYVTAVMLWCAPLVTHASAISHVGSTTVKEGQLNAEIRAGFSDDHETSRNNNRLMTRQHIAYGFNDIYEMRLITFQNKFDNDTYKQRDVRLEHRFHILNKQDYGFDGGARISYTKRSGRADLIRGRVAASGDIIDTIGWRHNTLLGHDVGAQARDGVQLEIRNQLNVDTGQNIAAFENILLGVDMFNVLGRLNEDRNFSRQQHTLGLIAKADIAQDYYVHLAYRKSLSKAAPDHAVGLVIGRNF